MSARTPVPAFGEVQDALTRLDGTTASAVTLLTGLTAEELTALGGIPDQTAA